MSGELALLVAIPVPVIIRRTGPVRMATRHVTAKKRRKQQPGEGQNGEKHRASSTIHLR
jgi:hypothetical protein